MRLHIGVDDTDSTRQGCTTYIGALIVEKLLMENVEFNDYPNLIRLNPNIPWKTRGNGAIALRINIEEEKIDEIERIIIDTVAENADLECEKTQPGIAFLMGDVSRELERFAVKAMRRLITIEEAERISKRNRIKLVKIKGGRGIIGAVSAIGATLKKDYTFELIAYRKPENWGTLRRIDENSVYEMDKYTQPATFNNIDYESGRVLIYPRGADPVLFGVRGEDPKILLKALELIKLEEPIERWMIYRTNQGTDMHFRRIKRIREIKPYDSIIIRGYIEEQPRTIKGGHVIIKITDGESIIDCAVYKPTGILTEIAKKMIKGDLVEIYGGVKPKEKRGLTINVEKIAMIKPALKIVEKNPKCPICGATMKSNGKNKGFKCPKCKKKANMTKIKVMVPRKISEGLFIPPPKAHRHLTKPMCRYGREKKYMVGKLIEKWYWSKKIN